MIGMVRSKIDVESIIQPRMRNTTMNPKTMKIGGTGREAAQMLIFEVKPEIVSIRLNICAQIKRRKILAVVCPVSSKTFQKVRWEYFPLNKEEALKQGYKWKDKEERNYVIDIKNEDIPNDIKDVKEDILGKVIECEHKGECNEQCTEAFKIISDELTFYKRMNLPLPHLCPNCRHYQRLKQRNPLKLWHRKCMHEGCNNEFETSYAPERPEIIYCEQCYNREVY